MIDNLTILGVCAMVCYVAIVAARRQRAIALFPTWRELREGMGVQGQGPDGPDRKVPPG